MSPHEITLASSIDSSKNIEPLLAYECNILVLNLRSCLSL